MGELVKTWEKPGMEGIVGRSARKMHYAGDSE